MRIPLRQQEVAPAQLRSAGRSPRVDAQDMGADVWGQVAKSGERLGAVADSAFDRAMKIQDERDAIQVLESVNGLADEERGWRTEALNRRGSLAVGVTKSGEDFWNQKIGEYEAKLPGDKARAVFKQKAAVMRDSALDAYSKHEAAEHRKSADDAITNTFQRYVNEVNDPLTGPEGVEYGIQDMRRNIDALKPGQDNTALKLKAEADLRAGYVGRLLISDPDGADAYMQQYRAAMGGHANALDGRLQVVREQRQVEGLYQAHKDIPLDAALGKLDADQSVKPEIRAKVVSALRTEDAIRKAAEREAQAKRDDEGLKLALDRWTQKAPLTLPEMQKAGLSGVMQEHVLKLQESWATNAEKKSDAPTLYSLTDRIHQGEIADSGALLQAVSESGGHVSQKDLFSLQEQVFRAQKEGTAADARKAKLAESVGKSAEQVFGLYYKGGIKKHEDAWGQFRRRLDLEIEAQGIESPEKARALMHDLMKEAVIGPRWGTWGLLNKTGREFERPEPSTSSRLASLQPIIDRQAKAAGLPPELLAVVPAMIRQESGGDASATSKKGAKGVMQLMPDAWAEMGGGDIRDPEVNIKNGLGYLKKMYDRFGSVELALAAYNAGPGAVEKHGGIPPFKETREYVEKITGKPQPPAEYPNAKRAPDGKWYVPDPSDPKRWALMVTK